MQCDLGRPGCRKCANAGRMCPGYRHAQDLMFRHETSTTVAKCTHSDGTFKRKERSNPKPISLAQRNVFDPCLCRRSSRASGVDTEVMTTALEFLYTDFFKGSSFEWIFAMHTSQQVGEVFISMVHATALAAYANEIGHLQYLRCARRIYDRCLLHLRTVIAEGLPIDHTILASVLLMSRFETLANDGDEDSIASAWATHVHGAYTLLKTYHQNKSRRDDISTALTAQTMQNYHLYRLYAKKNPVQEQTPMYELTDDERGSNNHDALEDLKTRSQALVDMFWSYLRYPRGDTTSAILNSILEARRIDDDVVALMQEMAVKIPFRTSIGDSDDTLSKPYQNHRDAKLWNSMRMVRLSLQDRIISGIHMIQCSEIQSPHEDNLLVLDDIVEQFRQDSELAIEEMANDVCDSALFFLYGDSAQCTYTTSSYLIWPLFVVGRVSHERKGFVRTALRKIGEEFKIRGALLGMENLDKDTYRDDWMYASYMS